MGIGKLFNPERGGGGFRIWGVRLKLETLKLKPDQVEG